MRRSTKRFRLGFRLSVLSLICVHLCFSAVNIPATAAEDVGPPLPGTKPLTMSGDIASELVAGVDRFLLKKIDESTAKPRATGSAISRRSRRTTPRSSRTVSGWRTSSGYAIDGCRLAQLILESNGEFDGGRPGAVRVRIGWPAFGDVTGEGAVASGYTSSDITIIVIPDAGATPEQFLGWLPGLPPESLFASRLDASHYEVFVPALIDRTVTAQRPGQAHQP